MSPSTSTRWCPTPEQLMILEEMYKEGLRTPNASQIQKITAHLSFYGKIEGKNVFYWFQNHKARDRQKLRRKLSKQLHQQQLLQEQLYIHQNHYPQNYNNYSVLNSIDPHFYGFHQRSRDQSAEDLHQGGVQGAQAQMTSYAWKVEPQPNMHEIENFAMRSYGDDWMMMTTIREACPTFPCCSNRPLKTLELFPITPPNVKERQGTTSKPSISSSKSTN